MNAVRLVRRFLATAALTLVAACSVAPTPDPTPAPTTFPVATSDMAATLAADFATAWAAGDFPSMHQSLDPALRERYPIQQFTELHQAFNEMAEVTRLAGRTREPRVVALPPEPRPAEFPPPVATNEPSPALSPDPSSPGSAPPPSSAEPIPAPDPRALLEGPVPAISVALELAVASDRFGALNLDRALTMVQGPDGWLVRWSPAVLFPELGDDGSLRLDRSLGSRGRIVGADGTVWAETREDGTRVYPQEWLAGQVIGYASEVTADDLAALEGVGYRTGDVVGRSGLESGAEDLLRGTPGWSLVAVPAEGPELVLLETEMVPGADVAITLRPAIQATAQIGLNPYAAAATAVVDPASGDVWALASSPAFNPNAMTLGATLAGEPLTPASAEQVFNKAILGAFPAGSSFKPFTLAAALDTGVAVPGSLVTCPPTWRYNETFTARNYLDHSLPGQVTLAEAMAFSCNTTYMPLAYEVYLTAETALTDLLFEFGFAAPTGIDYLVEEIGVVPDDAWLAANGRGGYSGFEQIQLAIGQGAFLGTPLQLANAYAAIGNGGTLWASRIMVTATLPDGTEVEEVEPRIVRQVSVTPANLAYVTDTLEAVVTLPYGTGTAAFAGFGLPVAGKSGTAETGTPEPHAWFPAYAPADAPTISVATVLNFIALGTGGTDAAPLVRQVMATHFAN